MPLRTPKFPVARKLPKRDLEWFKKTEIKLPYVTDIRVRTTKAPNQTGARNFTVNFIPVLRWFNPKANIVPEISDSTTVKVTLSKEAASPRHDAAASSLPRVPFLVSPLLPLLALFR